MKKDKGFWLVTVAAVVLYVFASRQAQAWRGYDAVGGEIMILTIPMWYRAVKDTIRETVSLAREIIREGEHDGGEL